nr:O-succinylbenzoic acid--CoA ligase [Parabacteroides sp.]
EALVLLVNGKIDEEAFLFKIKKSLPTYQIPKQIIEVDEIPYTSTGKINRAATKILAQKQIDYSKLT